MQSEKPAQPDELVIVQRAQQAQWLLKVGCRRSSDAGIRIAHLLQHPLESALRVGGVDCLDALQPLAHRRPTRALAAAIRLLFTAIRRASLFVRGGRLRVRTIVTEGGFPLRVVCAAAVAAVVAAVAARALLSLALGHGEHVCFPACASAAGASRRGRLFTISNSL